VFALTGIPLVRVASAPATGQYSVNNVDRQYTFAAADTLLGVLIDYAYTVSAERQHHHDHEPALGHDAELRVALPIKYGSGTLYLHLNSCISSKLSFATKIEDFLVPDFDFKAFADASDTVGYLSMSE
jgi:hypothetical protein